MIARSGPVLGILLVLCGLQGCLGLQHAAGCNNPGILGCKDKAPAPSEIEQPPARLKPAPPGGRAQAVAGDDSRYVEGHEHPWTPLLDDCMATGRTRTECFSSLPPDILEQFERWEAERASERHRQFQQRSQQPALGVEPVESCEQDCGQ